MLHVIPAYGRDYKSKAAVIADWASGKDFRIADMSSPNDGAYVNVADYPKGQLQVRFARMTKVAIINATDKPKAESKEPKATKQPSLKTLERWTLDGVAKATPYGSALRVRPTAAGARGSVRSACAARERTARRRLVRMV